MFKMHSEGLGITPFLSHLHWIKCILADYSSFSMMSDFPSFFSKATPDAQFDISLSAVLPQVLAWNQISRKKIISISAHNWIW